MFGSQTYDADCNIRLKTKYVCWTKGMHCSTLQYITVCVTWELMCCTFSALRLFGQNLGVILSVLHCKEKPFGMIPDLQFRFTKIP